MSDPSCLPLPGADAAGRLAVGICPSECRRQLVAVAIRAPGRAASLRPRREAAVRRPLDPPLDELLDEATAGPAHWATHAALLSDLLTGLVGELLRELGNQADDVLLVGIHDVGWWWEDPYLGRIYRALYDPARIAAQTGQNIWDALADSDLAVGGSGRQPEADGIWLLLADRSRLPGRRIRALLDVTRDALRIWLVPAAGQSLARHRPPVVIESARDGHGPVELARCVTGILRHQLPRSEPVAELLVGGTDGLALAGELSRTEPALEVLQLEELGWDRDELTAGAIAVCGLLTIDGLATNPSSRLVGGTPRLVGRFTPGTLCRWRHLAADMAWGANSHLPLRWAV